MITFDADNMIVLDGKIHALTNQEMAMPDNPLGNPCSICSLKEYCRPSGNLICLLLDANMEEFFVEVGFVNRSDTGQYHGLIFTDGFRPE